MGHDPKHKQMKTGVVIFFLIYKRKHDKCRRSLKQKNYGEIPVALTGIKAERNKTNPI